MDTPLLLRHADDLAAQAAKSGCAATKFLAPGEAEEVLRHFSRRATVRTATEGGFADAERVRVVFLSDWGDYAVPDMLAAVRVRYRAQDALTHRDVLGALMHLGITRATLGDIQLHGGEAYIICLPEMADYIAQNLIKIGRAGVTAGPIAIEDLPQKQVNIIEKSFTVPSLRLDCVIGGLYHLSRSKAAAVIAQGGVKIGHTECLKPDALLQAGDVLSVRGEGKARVLSIEGKTRKDRLRLVMGVYA